jgi:hypothetical protein
MNKLAALSAFVAMLIGAPSAMAQTDAPARGASPRAVVELFTSQGCSSCPPADRLIAAMARDPAVIALTLPVDYWDYLGWKDTLAHPAFSARQRHYAQLRGDSHVYTPQVVVNGAGHVVGSDKEKIGQLLSAAGLPVPVRMEESAAGALTIEIPAHELGRAGKRADILLMPVTRSAEVPIARGENRGKSITYAQVVRGIHPVGNWSGEAVAISLTKEKLQQMAGVPGADGFVVLLQVEGRKNARILGAARSPALLPPGS